MKGARGEEGLPPPGIAGAALAGLSWCGATLGRVQGARIGADAAVGKAEGQVPVLLFHVGGNRPGAEENDEEDRRRRHRQEGGGDGKTLHSVARVLYRVFYRVIHRVFNVQEARRVASPIGPPGWRHAAGATSKAGCLYGLPSTAGTIRSAPGMGVVAWSVERVCSKLPFRMWRSASS